MNDLTISLPVMKRFEFKPTVEFGAPIPLSDIQDNIRELQQIGIYILTNGTITDFTDKNIFYIGMSSKQLIYNRLTSHIRNWLTNKKPKIRKGGMNNQQKYAKKHNHTLEGMYVYPIYMTNEPFYTIPCMEGFLQTEFYNVHGYLPEACNEKHPGDSIDEIDSDVDDTSEE